METARTFLEALGPPETVSFVPGNHDAYVRAPWRGCWRPAAATPGTIRVVGTLSYLRRRGPVALIGLSSAIPTKPFVATGRLGPPQLAAAEALLRALATEPEAFRVVMIHHPPQPGGASRGGS